MRECRILYCAGKPKTGKHPFLLVFSHCNENPIYVILFWELRGLNPNFHIHVSVSNFYIPRIGPHFSCIRIDRSIVGIYKSLTDTWMWKLGLWPRNSFSGNIYYQCSVFCSAVARESLSAGAAIVTINVPVVYMAWDVMILMHENPFLRAIRGGGALNSILFWALKWQRANGVPIGPIKVETKWIYYVPLPPPPPILNNLKINKNALDMPLVHNIHNISPSPLRH